MTVVTPKFGMGASARRMEDTVYGEDSQLLSASFPDCAFPRADSASFFHFETRNVPSTGSAFDINGMGEAGSTSAAPAALNAVTDALYRACGVKHVDMPATPSRIWGAMRDAGMQ